MKLSLEQIKSITLGATDIFEQDGLVCFSRFHPAQLEMYHRENLDFFKKAQGTAGIRLSFRTDSENLSMQIVTVPGSSRKFFSVDVLVDGKFIGAMEGSPEEWPGEFAGVFSLGAGMKTVTVYLPWSVGAQLKEVTLDDGGLIQPVRPEKTLLIYGDSITQGYDIQRPSEHYTVKLAQMLGAEEHNRAIGGEVYHAELAQLEGLIQPDFVTIAYGTNDWSKKPFEAFDRQSREFLSTVSQRYPNAQIFVITPIWRKEADGEVKPMGPFSVLEPTLRKNAQGLSNVKVIPGCDLLPHNCDLFADGYLHPNDAGFAYYSENICKAIAGIIEN